MALLTIAVDSGADLAAAVAAAAERAQSLPGTLAGDVAGEAQAAVIAQVLAQRGTLSVSGIGASLGVDATVEGGSGTAALELAATPRRAWGLVSGARPHAIRTGKRAMRLKDGRFFAAVDHPGTPRRDYWQNSTTASEPVIRDAAAASATRNNPFR